LGRTAEAVDFIERSGHGGSLSSSASLPGVSDPDVVALLLAKTTTSEERGVRLVVDPASTVAPDGTTDLVTVLGNLIDNAVDAASPGGRVDVAVHRDGGDTVVTVADDGPGIPREDRDRVFHSGVSSKAAPAGRTRGIGLTLVRRVVTRRGGTATVDDAPAGGARFEVRIPDERHEPPAQPHRLTTEEVR
ncbi:MAG: sensor histidine kinase, partial [Nocardioidaceae bacterium]